MKPNLNEIKQYIDDDEEINTIDLIDFENERTQKENRPILNRKRLILEKNITNEIEEDFIDEIEDIINESLKEKVSSAKLEIFLDCVLSITQKQVKFLINQFNSTYSSQKIHKCMNYNDQFPYKINIFFPAFQPNIYQNYQPQFMMQPTVNSNLYYTNHYSPQMPIMQPQLFSLPNQYQYLENFQIAHKKKNQRNKKSKKALQNKIESSKNQHKTKSKPKDTKKKDKNTKKKDQKKSKSSNAIDSFNNLPLKSQQSTISEIIEKNQKSLSNNVFTNINNLLIYLLKFKPKSDLHYFSISPKSKQTTVENGIRNLDQIEILEAASKMLIESNSFKSSDFLDLLKKFEYISFELKYPSEALQLIMQQVSEMKKTLGKKIRFSAFIEGISKTDNTFKNNKELYKIRLGKTVTTISSDSFRGCTSLTKIEIPSSVTTIESSSFDGCSSLSEITIPSSVTRITQSCFRDCSSLTEITIPSSVTQIGSNAFRMCSSLRQITIPSSVDKICDHAFFGCKMLQQFTIPSSITSIESHTFAECSSLTQITIPYSVTSIGEFAFDKCSLLANVNIPSSVTKIGDFAFANCKALTEITIPSSVTSMGGGTLFLSKNLKKVTLPAALNYKGSLPSNARIIRK